MIHPCSSRYLNWSRTVGVYKKFVKLGIFHVSDGPRAVLQRMEEDADQSAILGGCTTDINALILHGL